MEKAIEAVVESADFAPAYKGEEYVTLMFRVPKGTAATPGIWELKPTQPGWPEWAKEKFPAEPSAD